MFQSRSVSVLQRNLYRSHGRDRMVSEKLRSSEMNALAGEDFDERLDAAADGAGNASRVRFASTESDSGESKEVVKRKAAPTHIPGTRITYGSLISLQGNTGKFLKLHRAGRGKG